MAADVTKFLKEIEGFSADPYKDERGFSTVGYGANLDDPTTLDTMKRIGLEKVENETDAEKLMQAQLAEKQEELKKTVPNFEQMTEGQKSALSSLVYNNPSLVGPTLRKHIEEGNHEAAAKQILLRSNLRQSPGLAKRRVEEAALYNDGKLPPLEQDEAAKIRDVLSKIQNKNTREKTLQRFDELTMSEAAPQAAQPTADDLYQMALVTPAPREIAPVQNYDIPAAAQAQLEIMRRREAKKEADKNDAVRQKGLNAIPFSPAINAYPNNPEVNQAVMQDVKQVGMPETLAPGPMNFPLPTAQPDTDAELAAIPLAPAGFDAAAASNSTPVEQQTAPSEADSLDFEQEPESDFLARYKAAQEAKRRDQMLDAILRASNQIGTAISGQGRIKADNSAIDAFAPLIGSELEDLKAQESARRETDLFDSNSEMAKLTRENIASQLRRIGADALADRVLAKKMSYDQLTKVFGSANLANMVSQYEAAQNRLMIAKERENAKKEKAEDRQQEKKDKFTQDFRKELTGTGAIGKAYNNFLNAERAEAALSQFAKDPSGYSDYASLMGSLKALQGDESVVREAEIRLGMQATSLGNKVRNWSDSLISGRMLQPAQRAQMIKAVKILSEVAKSQFERTAAPVFKQAQQMGIDRSLLVEEMQRSPAGATLSFDANAAAAELKRRGK